MKRILCMSLFLKCLCFLLVTLMGSTDYAFAQTAAEQYENVVSVDIPYGSGKERSGRSRLGIIQGENLPPSGPQSFSNDAEGNFYICDTINGRIQIYSKSGAYQKQISLPEEIVPNDLVIDNSKNFYVYEDFQGKLHQIDNSGNLLKSITIDKRQWDCRSLMRLVNDCIYMTDCDQHDVFVGKIVNGKLNAPTDKEFSPDTRGVHAKSGKRYLVKLVRWEKGTVQITGDMEAEKKIIELPLHGIVSIEFLKEDNSGNFYILTERAKDENIILEVVKFTSDGDILSTILIPENDYKTWTIKLISVDENGTIWQLLPQIERAKLNVFKQAR